VKKLGSFGANALVKKRNLSAAAYVIKPGQESEFAYGREEEDSKVKAQVLTSTHFFFSRVKFGGHAII